MPGDSVEVFSLSQHHLCRCRHLNATQANTFVVVNLCQRDRHRPKIADTFVNLCSASQDCKYFRKLMISVPRLQILSSALICSASKDCFGVWLLLISLISCKDLSCIPSLKSQICCDIYFTANEYVYLF